MSFKYDLSKGFKVALLLTILSIFAGYCLQNPLPAYAAEIVVTSTQDGYADDGVCTLREAVRSATWNSAVGGCASGGYPGIDYIRLEEGIYTLTEGELYLDSELVITGPAGDSPLVIIQAAQDNPDGINPAETRVVHVSDTGDATLENIQIRNGVCLTAATCTSYSSNGGGILNRGELTLINVRVTDNKAGSGGGIYNYGELTIQDSDIDNNEAFHDGGGIYNNITSTMTIERSHIGKSGSDNTAHHGGGLYTNGSTMITDSSISYNTTTGWAARGGGIYKGGGSLIITSSDITYNESDWTGGGIAGGSLTIRGGSVSNNISSDAGAGLHITGSSSIVTITGAHNNQGAPIDRAEIKGNQSDRSGAGIYINAGTLTVSDADFAGNTSLRDGGAIFNENGASTTVTASTFLQNNAGDDNYAGQGGAVYRSIGETNITGSCIYDNSPSAVYSANNGVTLAATGNWWGHSTGAGFVAGGLGDTVSTGVDTSNYLETAPDLCPWPVKPVKPFETEQYFSPSSYVQYDSSTRLVISITNPNVMTVSELAFSHTVPDGLAITGVVTNQLPKTTCNGNLSYTGNEISYDSGSLDAGAECKIVLYISGNEIGTYTAPEFTIGRTDTSDLDSVVPAASVEVLNYIPIIGFNPPIGDVEIFEGDTIHLSGYICERGPDTWTATVDYGDGAETLDLGEPTPAGPNTCATFELSRTYYAMGSWIVITATDSHGGQATRDLHVYAENVPPVIDLGDAVTVDEGATFSITASYYDPGIYDRLTLMVSFNNNDPSSFYIYADELDPVDASVVIEHIFNDDGIFPVEAHLFDNDFGHGYDVIDVTVNNVAPTVTIVGAPNIAPAGFQIDLSSIVSDPGMNDTHTVAWSVTKNDGMYETGNGSSLSFTPDEAGLYSVTVAATDDDGGVGEDTVVINVLPLGEIADLNNCASGEDAFKLIFTPDMQQWPSYKLTASNPGQFFFNTFYFGDNNQDTASLTVTIPYPFVTKGALPVHVYSTASVVTDGTNICFTPGEEVAALPLPISLDTYVGAGGEQMPAVDFTLDIPVTDGFAYISIHLDYGLKGTSGYATNLNGDALDITDNSVLIPNNSAYIFSSSGAVENSYTLNNVNSFKRIPGIGGLLQDTSGEVVSGADITIYDPAGNEIGIVQTDEDGWYMFEYKHVGKPALYTVVLDTRDIQVVEMRSNKLVVVDFVIN